MKKIMITVLFFCVIGAINAEEEIHILSFEDYLILVKEGVVDLRMNRLQTDRSEIAVFSSLSLHDVDWLTSVTGIGVQPYSTMSGTSTDYTPSIQTNTSFGTTLPSGTRLTIGGSYGQTWSSGTTPAGMSTEDFTSVTQDGSISIGLSQPMLNNWFGYLDRYNKIDARQKLDIGRLQQDENDRTVVLYYEKLYFLWIQYNNIIAYLEQTVTNANRMVVQTEEKRKSGLADNDDYQRTLQSVFTYEAQLTSFKLEKEKVENELSLYFEGVEYQPDNIHFSTFVTDYSTHSLTVVPFVDTRNAAIMLMTIDNRTETKKRRFNQTLPQINLYGSIDIKFHNYEMDSDSNPDPVTSYGDVDFTAGLEFRYSLGNHRARAVWRDAVLQQTESELQYRKMQNQYTMQITNIVSSVESIRTSLELNTKTLDSLKSRYKTEKTKYNQGRFELRNIVETENSITSQQMEIMKLQVQLIMLTLDYKKITE